MLSGTPPCTWTPRMYCSFPRSRTTVVTFSMAESLLRRPWEFCSCRPPCVLVHTSCLSYPHLSIPLIRLQQPELPRMLSSSRLHSLHPRERHKSFASCHVFFAASLSPLRQKSRVQTLTRGAVMQHCTSPIGSLLAAHCPCTFNLILGVTLIRLVSYTYSHNTPWHMHVITACHIHWQIHTHACTRAHPEAYRNPPTLYTHMLSNTLKCPQVAE